MTDDQSRIARIAAITGLVFCDEDCWCGEASHLWHAALFTTDEWWCANGWPTEDVEREIEARNQGRTLVRE